ncbi:siderophore-interacting protein [Kocuria sp. p3-SID1433]|uniref:siderophore-interacting protein n=1 Tax=unclassified Kocuria TaxID=2649579 RepID=UPI0021A7C71F|nr:MULTISPECIES: siderophore-interacting protein [unclassified Kocuria]MCT1602948.1 siderophore-interacting protein [Kocuria sp. p3-SID1428]MCT2180674.1 siderophore-interacting protein [Kocuria sp. p3-SID1433]
MSKNRRDSTPESARDRRDERRERKREGIGIRRLRVVRVEDITPRLRRIVLTGEDLGGFPFQEFAPSDKVKLLFPEPSTGVLPMPESTEKGLRWPGGHKPETRSYTVRGFDPEKAELLIEFVLHDHGIAGSWAIRAAPGDELGVLGPKGARAFPAAAHYVALGDETALPAISRLIEEAPAGSRVSAVIEVADAAEQQQLASRTGADVRIRWMHRDSTPLPGGCLSLLEPTVDELDLGDPEELFVFAAGESHAMKALRKRISERVRLNKHQLDIHGYWKDRTRADPRRRR